MPQAALDMLVARHGGFHHAVVVERPIPWRLSRLEDGRVLEGSLSCLVQTWRG